MTSHVEGIPGYMGLDEWISSLQKSVPLVCQPTVLRALLGIKQAPPLEVGLQRNSYYNVPKMVVHSIHSKAEFDDAIQSHDIVIIDAYATWCGPCRVISPVFEKLSEKKTKAHFVKVDVDKVPDVTRELGVRAMPTFIFFMKGERADQITGANSVALENAITSAIALSES